MGDHIQLSKFLMEPFSFFEADPDSGEYKSPVPMTYVYDVKNGKISKQKIKKLGTEYGYYTKETEEWLRDKEHQFKETIKYIQGFDPKLCKTVGFDELIIKQFCGIILDRSQNAMYMINEIAGGASSIINAILNKNNLPQVGALMGERHFSNYAITILLNNSHFNFVLPQCGLYLAMENQFMFPITPQKAILLYHKKESHFSKQPNHEKMYCHTDEKEVIDYYNQHAFEMEKAIGNKFIISKTIAELEQLKVLENNTNVSE